MTVDLVDLLLDSERATLAPICEFDQCPGYEVYKSDRFPFFYTGNGIAISDLSGADIEPWEDVFDRSFDRQRFRHRTFTFPDRDEATSLARAFELSGYDVTREALMLQQNNIPSLMIGDELEIKRVVDDADWRKIRTLDNEVYNDILNIDEDLDRDEPLFGITREVSNALSTETFYLTRKAGSEALSAIGVFKHGPLARLQGVVTAGRYRGRGYAEMMVRFITEYALENLDVSAVGLFADAGGNAIRLYRKCGFEEFGFTYTAMWFPPPRD